MDQTETVQIISYSQPQAPTEWRDPWEAKSLEDSEEMQDGEARVYRGSLSLGCTKEVFQLFPSISGSAWKGMACTSIKPHFTSVLPSTLPPWCCFLSLYSLLSRIFYLASSHYSNSYPLDICDAFRLTLPHISFPDGLWHILCSPVLVTHINIRLSLIFILFILCPSSPHNLQAG